MAGQAVQQRRRELLVATEDLGPLAEREIACDEDRLSFVAIRNEVEEQLATSAIEGDKSEFVEDQASVDGLNRPTTDA